MKLKLVVAVDKNNGIGKNGQLLVKNKEDMAFFKTLTTGQDKAVIMGRKTYESLPNGILKGRFNIVLSSKESLPNVKVPANSGIVLVHSVEEALLYANRFATSFVIGGETVYEQFVEYCTEAYVTYNTGPTEQADAFFNCLDKLGREIYKNQEDGYKTIEFTKELNETSYVKHIITIQSTEFF